MDTGVRCAQLPAVAGSESACCFVVMDRVACLVICAQLWWQLFPGCVRGQLETGALLPKAH